MLLGSHQERAIYLLRSLAAGYLNVMFEKDILMPNHIWTEQDDLMILFVYKFGIKNSPLTRNKIAEKIGVSLGSVSYRIGNFKAIDGIGNATHYTKLSLNVHSKYSNLNEIELRQLAFGNV